MATFIIGTIVIGAMGFAAYKSYKNHQSGSCGCGCEGCTRACASHKK